MIAAKLNWPGELFAGQVLTAKLSAKASGAKRGTAALDSGQEVLVDHLPTELTEGAEFPLVITRAPIAEKGRLKKPQGRFSPEPGVKQTFWLDAARETRAFPSGCWEEIWQAASTGVIEFAGGSLTFSVTPAMTLIDVDGDGSPRDVSLAAVPAIARWLPLFDLGGNIGIDFPTINAKPERKAVDTALEYALADWAHERTAMNGFGFVQIIARMEGPSLLHRFATSRVGMCARMALRLAERANGTGNCVLLTVHPALKAKLKTEWPDELARRTGRQVRIETDPALALEAPSAQLISS